jgi:hypothetical protein
VDKKDMGLLMRERLADKIVDFKLPQFVDRSGEPILSVHPFTEIQAKNTTQASTIGEALRRKFTRSSMDAKSMDKVEKIIKSSKTNVGDLDLKKLNRTLTDKGYTPEERNLINAYARGFDSSMNEVLRANHDLATLPENTVNKFYLDKAEQLKQALLKNKINSEEIPYVFRGVTDHNVELVDPKTLQPTGKIIRKTELQKGDMFLDRGFASTTYHPHRKGWGTFEASEKIIIPPGLKLSGASPNSLGHSYFPHEKEIILPSGLIRRVDDVIEKVSAADGERFVTSVVNPYKKGGLVKYQGLTGSSQVREDKTALPTLNVEANRPGFWERLRSSNYNPYNWGLPDYSELKSPTEALYKAAYYGEPEFMWRGHRTNIDDVWGAIPMEDRLLNTGKLNWEDDISFFDDSKHPQVPFYDRHHNNLITLPVENVKQYQKEYTDALNYTKEWLNSPMYNKMLKESTSGDSPKYLYNIESGRRWNLENASPVVNITDKTWSINGTDTPAAGWSSENGISIVNDEDNLPLSELEVKIKNPGLYNKDFYFPEERDLIAFQLKQEKDKRTKDWLRTLFTHEFSHHTDKHGTASRLIPRKDVEYILNNKLSNKESKKLLNTLNDSYTRYSEDPKAWNAFYRDYVGEPTEVRARLQEIRQYARNNGIYDPFTQEIDDKTLQKLIDNNRSVPGLWDLINVYKPEQIKYMLNHISENKTDNQGVMSNNIQYGKKGGLVKAQEGKEMPFGLPLKEQNIYLLPEYNQPRNPMTGEILPDPQRPNLGMGTGATEYKYTYGSDQGDIDVPSVVAGQYIGDQALDRYMLTGERFKTMADPGSYSKFYNETGRLGLMQEKKGGSVRKVKIKRAPRKNQ